MRLRLLPLYLIAGLAFLGTVTIAPGVFASSSESVSVNISPENPAPNENTTITLGSYADNLNSVQISWSINGKSLSSGIGKKTFSVSAPAAGSQTTVIASISFPDGVIQKEIVISPTEMVLLWQATDSYVPPFYKGKAMPTPGSQIRVVAIPEIKNGAKMEDPKNLVYAWKQDYNNSVDDSGYGKNSFTYTNDYLERSNNIAVTASTTDAKYSSDASIDIGATNPKILFYKNDTNLGTIWEQTLEDGHQIQGDETIQAAPYFVSPKDIRIPFLTWDWSINDSLVNNLTSKKNLLPLKAQAGVSGTAKIKLEINNMEKIFVTASKEINVEF